MEAAGGSSETSLFVYVTARRHIVKDKNAYLYVVFLTTLSVSQAM